jgi:hypothetical protein
VQHHSDSVYECAFTNYFFRDETHTGPCFSKKATHKVQFHLGLPAQLKGNTEHKKQHATKLHVQSSRHHFQPCHQHQPFFFKLSQRQGHVQRESKSIILYTLLNGHGRNYAASPPSLAPRSRTINQNGQPNIK